MQVLVLGQRAGPILTNMRRGLAAALLTVLFVSATSCNKTSLTEPAPTPTPIPTPTPVPLLPAGLFGLTALVGSHGEFQALAPGIKLTITQGAVTLSAVSGTDGSYIFPVGGGLVGPAYCKVFSTAPSGYQAWNGLNLYVTPGLNGPVGINLVGVGPP